MPWAAEGKALVSEQMRALGIGGSTANSVQVSGRVGRSSNVSQREWYRQEWCSASGGVTTRADWGGDPERERGKLGWTMPRGVSLINLLFWAISRKLFPFQLATHVFKRAAEEFLLLSLKLFRFAVRVRVSVRIEVRGRVRVRASPPAQPQAMCVCTHVRSPRESMYGGNRLSG